MWQKIKELVGMWRRPKDRIYFKNITNSSIQVLRRASFEVSHEWFESLLAVSYDEEIRAKYIPELHQISDFEINQLKDVLQFENCKLDSLKRIELVSSIFEKFKREYVAFHQNLVAENIKIIDPNHRFIQSIEALNQDFEKVNSVLVSLYNSLQKEGYLFLNKKNCIRDFPSFEYSGIRFSYDDWEKFLDTEPLDSQLLLNLSYNSDQVYYEMSGLKESLTKLSTHCKIIVGNAGTGKTHISAHLVNRLKENGDCVIFFKARQFNDDNVILEARILHCLKVPEGYTLSEILVKINEFASTHNKRCFLIIDALNETTKSSIGFSNIWRDQLQHFINQIGLFSHLYFICTLRTSYIDSIWATKPRNLAEIRGFGRMPQLRELCTKYFGHYRIDVQNLNTADLNAFRTPLLLALYCKLINEDRKNQKEIILNMNTYVKVFEDYVETLINEVKQKLSFQQKAPIKEGFRKSSELFFLNNEATLKIDEFSQAFDGDNRATTATSIASAVLDGYLIFIKDAVNKHDEIVKHTQQEVGGYLISKYLIDKFPSIDKLVQDSLFSEKVTGDNLSLHHQLRLDILKFLISQRPELIPQLRGKEVLSLSWWYLYNGFDIALGNSIPNYLVSEGIKEISIDEIMNVSSIHLFNPDHEFNFLFIAQLLERLDMWEFDTKWTFYIYKEVDFFYETINDNIDKIRNTEECNLAIAKFIAFTTATTIRELRDLATIYLIEFGKKHPIHLLDLTEHSASLPDDYIYERLVSCCYGISLILQNEKTFVESILPQIAGRLFQLQFARDAPHPVFNYIVIDSVKHIVDLAVHKGVSPLRDLLQGYQFQLPNWDAPTRQQQRTINKSSRMSWPEPIGMDFGIYTIPRLIDDEHYNTREAIANVYKRIFELGYQILDYNEIRDSEFSNFYFGNKIYGIEGKIDRLGKKYSWKGFFDFAGVLLKNGQLNVFNQEAPYRRLSDVDIDISFPNKEHKLDVRLYKEDLIVEREGNSDWYKHIMIDSVKNLFEQTILDSPHIMLYGKINQQINSEYKTRSYIIIDSFFIKKNSEFDEVKNTVSNYDFNWDLDTHGSTESFSSNYFGELYWADTMPDNIVTSQIAVPTGEKQIIKVNERPYPFLLQEDEEYLVDKEVSVNAWFDWEPTLGEYRWESDSILLKGFWEYYPSVKLARSLKLVADPQSGKVLAEDLTECFQCIHFDENYFQNDFNYLKSDLVRKYMVENDLALLYQVKQHSYDVDLKHNRILKFFVLE